MPQCTVRDHNVPTDRAPHIHDVVAGSQHPDVAEIRFLKVRLNIDFGTGPLGLFEQSSGLPYGL
jgi:hypothetical protein